MTMLVSWVLMDASGRVSGGSSRIEDAPLWLDPYNEALRVADQVERALSALKLRERAAADERIATELEGGPLQ
ncbi:MAG TPA: hypothetical protein VGS12_13465 [Caulobacteraceae bacterium]|nr:hypothetical protein [Caulobacteraceae bacterium]